MKVSNVINNTSAPSVFLVEGGIGDASHILRTYHKQALAEGQKAKDIENDVIIQLSGLRSDLGQKIKEIKNLSGDFKNSVDKEMDGTRKAISSLQEALSLIDTDPHAIAGKGDPYLARLGVDRQVEKQIDEENYLHQAFLNLEGSGRELESIIVGEIQKAYNAYAGILKREADEAYDVVERLRSGPIAMAKDYEWTSFVENDPHFVDPKLSLRKPENIIYPGQHHPAAAEVRAGMLERKSKYLKSYTPGWYVLSPTHLHEFKSADRVNSQPPVMSLYLPEQKLGSHSQPGSSSHKFMLKGRQTGSMHRGHSWVLRAETHETMLAWYEDIKSLTEKTGEERNAFVRSHARSLSTGSQRAPSVSSEGAMEEDEADAVPYSANASLVNQAVKPDTSQRPQPGGRFPSDLQVNRGLQAPLSPSSGSSDPDRDIIAAAGALPGQQFHSDQDREQYGFTEDRAEKPGAGVGTDYGAYGQEQGSHGYQPYQAYNSDQPDHTATQPYGANQYQNHPAVSGPNSRQDHDPSYGGWAGPAAAGVGGAAVGVAGAEAYRQHQRDHEPPQDENGGTFATHEKYQPGVAENAPIVVGGTSNSQSSEGGAGAGESSATESAANTLPTSVDNNFEDASKGNHSSFGTSVETGLGQSQPDVSSEPAAAISSQTSKSFTAPEVISGSHTVQPGEGHMHIPGEFPPTPAGA
ncbi:hypothetical protein L228DRAFT_163846 [Xylona heveae TC161]|uniref:PH domain-containing protein n=1 Tax=Xylona heveae (strain CBS 132557 / TC161) TaxID=1328760 RepID=A0A165GA70_XYLHT|nr:hypothetical protein L228DRAFT_163846 [Xylona heveae TC161]KZF21940.1 hypothetical protein L228DRAFT_163846 [Xylona heveae TC161]